jgi:CBS domain-containing protein
MIENLDEYLAQVKSMLVRGTMPPTVTVRELVNACGSQRRGVNVINRLRSSLEAHGLTTEPSFEYEYIDDTVHFSIARSESVSSSHSELYRIGMLESANRIPTCIKPNASIEEAATIMLANDFSQLPVLSSPREIKGVVSWKTIGRGHALHVSSRMVGECMDQPKVIERNASLFDAIKIVMKHEYVLVLAEDRSIGGIVTGADMSLQFKELAEPFLAISEIEAGVRRLLSGKFTLSELAAARNPTDSGRAVTSIFDLSFGEYVRLLEHDKMWQKLGVSFDKSYFLELMRDVTLVRNDIMHFDPQGIEPQAMERMKTLLRLLKNLRKMSAIQ